jgi:ribosomal-protein-alanine N-acetyltransferase
MIKTINLELVPCELIHFEASMSDKKELGQLLGATVPDSWPVFPETMPHAYAWTKADPSLIGWGTYLFVQAVDRVLIGEGGYKGHSDAAGMVEIGYAIIPEYRRRGLATEAARGLTAHAFSEPHVKIVEAHTLPEPNASTKILGKLGMRYLGPVHDPVDGEIWHWRLTREDYERFEEPHGPFVAASSQP